MAGSIFMSGKTPAEAKAVQAVSGEHRPLACSVRQLAERIDPPAGSLPARSRQGCRELQAGSLCSPDFSSLAVVVLRTSLVSAVGRIRRGELGICDLVL